MRIERSAHLRTVQRLLREHPVVALVGARQVGKTTLMLHVIANAQKAGGLATRRLINSFYPPLRP